MQEVIHASKKPNTAMPAQEQDQTSNQQHKSQSMWEAYKLLNFEMPPRYRLKIQLHHPDITEDFSDK